MSMPSGMELLLLIIVLVFLTIVFYSPKHNNSNKIKFCGHCGERLDDNEIFCHKCGNKLTN